MPDRSPRHEDTASAPSATSCPFCVIVTGDGPGFVVERTGDHVAFLDIRPLFPGHTLVVPRRHIVTLEDLPATAIGSFFTAVQRIERAVRGATGAAGSFVAVNNTVSQSVAHLHVHVVPRTKGDGLRGFFWPRTRYPDDATAASMAQSIAAALIPARP